LHRTDLSAETSISACLLCYNDAETISGLVDRAATALDQLDAEAEIVVVDDGSTDDSVVRLAEAAALEPRLRVVEHAANRGYGGALRSALAEARGEWIFYTDGDGQYDPAQLVRLAEHAGDNADWIQGYKRYRSDPLNRRLVGAVYAAAMGFLFGLPIRDIDCDFRLMRAELIRGLRLEKDSGAICVELVRGLQDAGARCVELEVDHFERPHGRSQFFRPRRILWSLWDVATLWSRLIGMPALRRLAGGRSGASFSQGQGPGMPGAREASSSPRAGARGRSGPDARPPTPTERARTGSRG
jgi:glycosyltransferase involved in cell wall biosynthesis